MEFEVLGDADTGPTLSLDHRRFAYAGKFVMSTTGKLVAREDDIVGAVSFSPDRTDEDRAWLRYLTVARDRRGEGIGPRLAAAATTYLHDRGFEEVRIGVNNPFAYQALYRAGFGWTGEETGIAELVLAHPDDRPAPDYRAGLSRFGDRGDLSDAEIAFIADHREADPPPVVDPPD
ncbi:MAG: GNAT family N-acetyltransferase [Halobacteriaceae archaeon]